MGMKEILEEIDKDIADVVGTNFIHNLTSIVPNLEDVGLTYERGQEKKGKLINTCVLFVDIRNSVALTEKHHTQTMGRIYTAFTKAVLKVARYHGGHTRNIIGDRVMIVFPCENCCTNAVDCAISINHIAKNIINKKIVGIDFKCGIGIDLGELRVIKVGIQRRGTEKGENKGLVWVGKPANIVSRLTDNANKTFKETLYKVERYPFNPFRFPQLLHSIYGLGALKQPNTSPYSPIKQSVIMSSEEFAKEVTINSSGKFDMLGGKFISFKRNEITYDYPSILITEAVYKGLKKDNATRNDILGGLWKEQKHNIKDVSGKIYGSNLNWKVS
jgi:class 3 adenylate cyclase